jgi:hypothetical protein
MQYALLIYEDEAIFGLGKDGPNAAIAIAKRVPLLEDGAIEVRPVLGPG